MRSMSGREKLLTILAGLVLFMSAVNVLGTLSAKNRELGNMRRQTDLLRATIAVLSETVSYQPVATTGPTREDLMEIVARAGHRLESIQVSQTENGLSAEFSGDPEQIWALYSAISAAGDVMVDELLLKRAGSRLRGTLTLVVAP